MQVESRLISAAGGGEERSLVEIAMAALREGKVVLLFAVVLSLLVTLSYIYVATPIYQADALIEVEDESSALGIYSELGDAAFSDGSVGAEIEIIRSRSVLGEVVDQLELQVEIEPEYSIPYGTALVRNTPWLARAVGVISDGNSLPSVEFRRFEVL